MKKIIFTLINFLIFQILLFSKPKLIDYNQFLILPFELSEEKDIKDREKEKKTTFSFNIGNVDGELNIIGEWDIKIGYGVGFTLYPELVWILTLSNFREGLIFEQKRLFSLDWITDSGIFLHLFFNDDINASEFTFKYEHNKTFKSLYITNRFNGLQVNPYRELTGGNVSDINFGFDWQTRVYKGRFDLQFDSTKMVVDRFRGNKKFIENKILSAQYMRGYYYYLPDKNIIDIEVYISIENKERKGNEIEIESLYYKKLIAGIDYIVDISNGVIKFKESVYKKQVIVNYKTRINSSIYEVGDTFCGIKGLYGEYDFNKNLYPEYFINYNGKRYLILSFKNNFSYFEEKNSYKISDSGDKIDSLFVEIYDNSNKIIVGYNYYYDDFTGGIRITLNSKKGDKRNIYPFIDYVNEDDFYLIFSSPNLSISKNIISHSFYLIGSSLTLSNIPVNSSISVYLNSILLSPLDYSYDFSTNKILLNREIMDSDTIEVRYFVQHEQSFNLTASLKNDFRINQYLLLGDSYWYKMPVKLWEDSFYNDLKSMEFLYSIFLKGDFKKKLIDSKNGKLEFDINATLSLFLPELKGLSIIEDFERESRGYPLPLDYKKWYPSSAPEIYTDLATATYGKLFYRNTHKNLVKSNNNYISIYDLNIPEKDETSIGPYSSSDGFNNERNSLSLIAEFDLKANQYVSFTIPIKEIGANLDFSNFKEFIIAIKSIELTGNVRIYVDGGLVGEIFNEEFKNVQYESFDEGIKYIVDSASFYKSKNDGVNISNDFDEDGRLLKDETDDISPFIEKESLNNFLEVFSNFKKVVNFNIEKPMALKRFRGLRITIYSLSGAKGRILFNQFRFAESGWNYDRTKSSYGIEIFPAEDEFLKNNIFSINNSEFDKKLHFQRFRERTLKINLKMNESFSISKDFISPIEIFKFKKIGFFILLKENSSRILNLNLKDIEGNTITKSINLSSLSKGKWHNIEFDLSSFDGISNNYINRIEFDFKIQGSETFDNVIFIDELYLNEPYLMAGFSNKNEFLYRDSGVDLKYKNFSIFKNPYIKILTIFSTPYFLKEEFTQINNFSLNSEIGIKFNFIGTDFHFFDELLFLFNENIFIFGKERFNLNILKNSTKNNPFILNIYYEFQRSTYERYFLLDRITLNRKIFFDIGTKFDYFYFKLKFDSLSKKVESTSNFSKFEYDSKFNYEGTEFNLYYNIFSEKRNNYISGIFSFDNLGLLFLEDLKLFFEESISKGQTLKSNLSFLIMPDLLFKNTISYNNNSFLTSNREIFGLKTLFTNNNIIELNINYNDKNKKFLEITYNRESNLYYESSYTLINWQNYFKEFAISFNSILPVILYPPFSSLFVYAGVGSFKNLYFNELKDSFSFVIDWSIFLEDYLFLPYSFKFSVSEKNINLLFYTSLYDLSFGLYGKGETYSVEFKKINVDYSIEEKIKIDGENRNFITNLGVIFKILFLNELEFSSDFSYSLDYNEFYVKREFKHNFIIKNSIYKDFFEYDYSINDKKGIELLIKFELNSLFYTRIDKITENRDIPLTITIEPRLGYRFNKYITISGNLRLGYSLEYSQVIKNITNRFGLEFFINGSFRF